MNILMKVISDNSNGHWLLSLSRNYGNDSANQNNDNKDNNNSNQINSEQRENMITGNNTQDRFMFDKPIWMLYCYVETHGRSLGW